MLAALSITILACVNGWTVPWWLWAAELAFAWTVMFTKFTAWVTKQNENAAIKRAIDRALEEIQNDTDDGK